MFFDIESFTHKILNILDSNKWGVENDLTQVSDDVKKMNPDIFRWEADKKKKKPSKYRNVRTMMDGMSFDSGKEAVDAQKFMLAVRAGEYIAYLHHVRFPLPGRTYYEADHVLINNDLTVSVYDSKGPEAVITPVFKLKKRLFSERYHKEIEEIWGPGETLQ